MMTKLSETNQGEGSGGNIIRQSSSFLVGPEGYNKAIHVDSMILSSPRAEQQNTPVESRNVKPPSPSRSNCGQVCGCN